MSIYINSIIEWRQGERIGRRDRVLLINTSNNQIFLIDIDAKATKPYRMSYTELLELAEGEINILVLKDDPLSILHIDGASQAQSQRQIQRNNKPEQQQQRTLEQRTHREKAWLYVQQLVLDDQGQVDEHIFEPKYRGKRIREVGLQTEAPSTKTLNKWLQYYWQGGQTKTALNTRYHNCGAPGRPKPTSGEKRGRKRALFFINGQNAGINITDREREFFQRATRRYYAKQKLSLEATYQKILETYFCKAMEETPNGLWVPQLISPEQRPTFDQFYEWYRSEGDSAEDLRLREGERNYALKHRALLGTAAALAKGPGDIYQLDATPGITQLVDALHHQQHLGRSTDYLCTDAFSRSITGFHSYIGSPSWNGMRIALNNTFTNKVLYCAQFDVHITSEQWPMEHLCAALLFDRGEGKSKNSDSLPEFLSIRTSNTAPFRADWKSLVERGHRSVQDLVGPQTPGRVKKAHERERGERDPRLGAALTPLQYIRLLISIMIHYNNHHYLEGYPLDREMLEAGVEPYPIELWNWGVQNRSGHLRQESAVVINRNLLPQDQVSVTEFGIFYKGLYYECDYAAKHRWYEKARREGRWQMTASHYPNSSKSIYLHIPGQITLELCVLRKDHQEFGDLTHADWDAHNLIQRHKHRQAAEREQEAQAILNAQQESIIGDALEESGSAAEGLSDRKRLAGIKDNRRQATYQNLDDLPLSDDKNPFLQDQANPSVQPAEKLPSSELSTSVNHRPDFTDELRTIAAKVRKNREGEERGQ